VEFGDLLIREKIDPKSVLVLRHKPNEPEFQKVFPWLAANQPDVFNAYQQTQTVKVEKAMLKSDFVASFIGHAPGKAMFIGLYKRGDTSYLRPILGQARLSPHETIRF